MNNIINKSAMSFKALAVAVVFLITLIILSISSVTHAANNVTGQSGRLITIHDRGTEKVILTRSATIGDVLKEADIDVDAKDVVEPSLSEKLVASNYQVNIYRARPIIIVDGNIRQKVMTPYQTAEQIAASVGITIYPEDKTEIDRVDNLSEGAGLQMTITRSTPFVFTLFGKTSDVRTMGQTVAEMLAEKGIKIGKDDRLSVDINSKIISGMNIRIWREGKQTITVDEEVNFDIEKIENADREVEYREVRSAGTKGLRSVSYEIIVQDGVEVSRTEIASLILKQPIKQVEMVGIKGKYTTPSENENITWDFLISQGFSRVQTAGIMGNLMQEHGFSTTDTPGGLGIVQWMGSRRTNLINQYPDSYTNIYSQLNYLMYELNNGYRGVRDAILASGSLEDSVIIFQNRFEKCGICRESNRITFARNILASH